MYNDKSFLAVFLSDCPSFVISVRHQSKVTMATTMLLLNKKKSRQT